MKKESEKRTIPFFNYPALFSKQKEQLMPLIEEVLDRGAYIMQKDLYEIEEQLADFLDAKAVVGVADGTMALILSLRAAGIGPGDEVLVPSHTFVASAAAIKNVGGSPILVDCASDHLIAPGDIEHRINKSTKAIMPVHLNGRTANMKSICEIADNHNLQIIEDSAQALGSKFNGQCAGTFGFAGICSFYPSKTLGCFGDGGAVITNDLNVADEIRKLRDHGRVDSGEIVTWGYNSRLDNLQAAILLHKLSRYEREIEKRRELARIYDENLHQLVELHLPPAPDADPIHFDIFQNYEIEAKDRDRLKEYLSEKGIGTIVQWGGWMIHQNKQLQLNSDLPRSQDISSKMLLLPMNTSLENTDVEYICEEIRNFYQNGN
jgi:dTDP-4-amino-4,6-dideoxygalactose transaminase